MTKNVTPPYLRYRNCVFSFECSRARISDFPQIYAIAILWFPLSVRTTGLRAYRRVLERLLITLKRKKEMSDKRVKTRRLQERQGNRTPLTSQIPPPEHRERKKEKNLTRGSISAGSVPTQCIFTS